ncbi:MAG: hypothetical protein HYU68_11710 [Bacteroidetes bacterium]|nr:hypothetical protein [Bacteroidota bacterium]
MKINEINLFIVNVGSKIKGLSRFFYKRPRSNSNGYIFYTDESYPGRVEKSTVPFVFSWEDQNEIEVLTLIQSLNSKPDVAMRPHIGHVKTNTRSFGKRTTYYFRKNEKRWRKLTPPMYRAIPRPIYRIEKEYEYEKFIAIFLITFFWVGIVVFLFLRK